MNFNNKRHEANYTTLLALAERTGYTMHDRNQHAALLILASKSSFVEFTKDLLNDRAFDEKGEFKKRVKEELFSSTEVKLIRFAYQLFFDHHHDDVTFVEVANYLDEVQMSLLFEAIHYTYAVKVK